MENKYAIILAAGKGTRMKSLDDNHSKVSFQILGKSLVNYVLDALLGVGVDEIVAIVGFGGEVTKSLVEAKSKVVWQKELLGTGHAVMQTKDVLKGKKGSTIIACGDTPLLTSETISKVFEAHQANNNKLTVVTAVIDNPKGYGRIIRDNNNNVLGIREDKDCSPNEKLINEINSGLYVFDNELLYQYLDEIKPNNAQHEYYLTDLISLFVNGGHKVGAYIVEDITEIFGINDRSQLAYAAKVIKKRINKAVMLSGVTLQDPDTTYISAEAKIGQDSVIEPCVSILGKTVIGQNCHIGQGSYIVDSEIPNNTTIECSKIVNQKIDKPFKIGPFKVLEK